jgi:hypothetical protein
MLRGGAGLWLELKLGLEEELGLWLELKLGLAHRQGEKQGGDTPPHKIDPKRFDFQKIVIGAFTLVDFWKSNRFR